MNKRENSVMLLSRSATNTLLLASCYDKSLILRGQKYEVIKIITNSLSQEGRISTKWSRKIPLWLERPWLPGLIYCILTLENFFFFFLSVDGENLPWGNWTDCEKTCNPGRKQNRTRECTFHLFGGVVCPGPTFEEQMCPPCGGKTSPDLILYIYSSV